MRYYNNNYKNYNDSDSDNNDDDNNNNNNNNTATTTITITTTITTMVFCLTGRLARVPPMCLKIADATFTGRMPFPSPNQELQRTDRDGCVDSVPISLR